MKEEKPHIVKRGWDLSMGLGEEPQSRESVLKKAAEAEDLHTKTLEDSFPCSDPPASGNFDS